MMTFKKLKESIERKLHMSDEQVNTTPPVDQTTPPANQQAQQQPATPEAGEVIVPPASQEEADKLNEKAPEKVFYMGQEVTERLDKVTGDGRECRLADGSTTYVPLKVLGE